ncbi:MAG: hypothetical protein Q4D38_03920 [Planctomycetia bacterium]|nr:hypothetical protein [Planctomycetia bacterium]
MKQNTIRIILIVIIGLLLGVTCATYYNTAAKKKANKIVADMRANISAVREIVKTNGVEAAREGYAKVCDQMKGIENDFVLRKLLLEFAVLHVEMSEIEQAKASLEEGFALIEKEGPSAETAIDAAGYAAFLAQLRLVDLSNKALEFAKQNIGENKYPTEVLAMLHRAVANAHAVRGEWELFEASLRSAEECASKSSDPQWKANAEEWLKGYRDEVARQREELAKAIANAHAAQKAQEEATSESATESAVETTPTPEAPANLQP